MTFANLWNAIKPPVDFLTAPKLKIVTLLKIPSAVLREWLAMSDGLWFHNEAQKLGAGHASYIPENDVYAYQSVFIGTEGAIRTTFL